MISILDDILCKSWFYKEAFERGFKIGYEEDRILGHQQMLAGVVQMQFLDLIGPGFLAFIGL